MGRGQEPVDAPGRDLRATGCAKTLCEAYEFLGVVAFGEGRNAEAISLPRRGLRICEDDLAGNLPRARLLTRMAASGDAVGAGECRAECLRIVAGLGLDERCLLPRRRLRGHHAHQRD